MVLRAYLFLMCMALPFYMTDGYHGLGNAKFNIYRVISITAIVLIIICLIIFRKGILEENSIKLRAVDYLIFVCIISEIIIFLFARDKAESLWGTTGWRMGFLPSLLFLFFLFAYRNLISISEWDYLLMLPGPTIAILLAVFNRFGIYPIEISGQNASFLSTIGNINWYIGFLAVFLQLIVSSVFVFGYRTTGIYYLIPIEILFLVSALTQGSESGVLMLCATYVVLLRFAIHTRSSFRRFLFQIFLLGISMVIVQLLMYRFGDYYNYEVSMLMSVSQKGMGIILMAASILVYVITIICEKRDSVWKNYIYRYLYYIFVFAAIAVIFVVAIRSFDDSWGNGRGIIWKISARAYSELSDFRKIVGVGQDGFTLYCKSVPDINGQIQIAFGSSRLTNAHCLPLTTIINKGLLGLITYILLFAAIIREAWKKYKDTDINSYVQRALLINICLLTFIYIGIGTVSFDHILITPYVFIGMGLCTNKLKS